MSWDILGGGSGEDISATKRAKVGEEVPDQQQVLGTVGVGSPQQRGEVEDVDAIQQISPEGEGTQKSSVMVIRKRRLN